MAQERKEKKKHDKINKQMLEEHHKQIDLLQKDPAYFAEMFFTVNGEPYSLKNFPYARQIHEDNSEFIILFMARSLTKSTIMVFKAAHTLLTQANRSCIATAPTDSQAWRLTKEIFRPAIIDSQEGKLKSIIEGAGGADQVGEIELINKSRYTAKGCWATGKSLRGPHRHIAIADEMQDMTRTAWYVLLETANLQPRQVIAAGTGGPTGTIWHELWMKSDQKEWDIKSQRWIVHNKNATPGYSGYHCTQEASPFETPASLADKKKNYPKTLYTTEVECDFYNVSGMKPAAYEVVKECLITDMAAARIMTASVVSKVIAIDWGDRTRWVLAGRTENNHLVILRTGVWGDPTDNDSKIRKQKESDKTILEIEHENELRRAKEHVSKAKALILKEQPDFIMCDAGYSKKKNQELMAEFPGKVWAITAGERKESIPDWVIQTRDPLTKSILPASKREYFCNVDHSAMCEYLEMMIQRNMFHIIDPTNSQEVDEYLLELNMADIIELETRETIKRRYVVSKAHGYAATAYVLLTFQKNRRNRKMYPACV